MKKNLLLFLIVIAVVAYSFFSKSKDTPPPANRQIEAREPTPADKKLIDRVRDFPGLASSKLTDKEKTSECKLALESIETLPVTALLRDLQSSRIKLSKDCLFTWAAWLGIKRTKFAPLNFSMKQKN